MPNRIIKESICTSETLAEISPAAERLWWRLVVQCDDFGRMDGRVQVIRARCFPLQVDALTNEEVEQWLCELVEEQLIVLYKSDNKPYLYIVAWDKHQQRRAKYSKYPSPDATSSHLQSSDRKCKQMQVNDTLYEDRGSEDRGSNTRNEDAESTDSRTTTPPPSDKPNNISENERIMLAELQGVKNYPLDYETDLDHIRKVTIDYPQVDMLTEVKKWCAHKLDNPLKKKHNPRLQLRNWVHGAAPGGKYADKQPAKKTNILDADDIIYGEDEDQ